MKPNRASTKPCPVCRRSNRVLRVAPSGFWEQQVFARFSCFPFRCRKCGRRFLRRVENEPRGKHPENDRPEAPAETRPVLVPAPAENRADASKEFRQLVEALREAEKARGLAGSKSENS